jgi:sugar/nucleoside kinase (ribokinase family)
MSDLWSSLLQEFCPSHTTVRRKIFFDLADPEKRTPKDILRALDIIRRFEQHFDVILGLNEKEAYAIGEVLGIQSPGRNRDDLAELGREMQKRLPISTFVLHPVTYALAVSNGTVSTVDGPYVDKPLITTGAGDHFNAGFCLAKLLGFDNSACVLLGVATSGFYVRNAQTPSLDDLVEMLRNWPEKP